MYQPLLPIRYNTNPVLLPTSLPLPYDEYQDTRGFIIAILFTIVALGKVNTALSSSQKVQPSAYHPHQSHRSSAFRPSSSFYHFSSSSNFFSDSAPPASHHPWSAPQQWNKKQHSAVGNRDARGPSIQIAYWNKGSSSLGNKRLDVSAAIAKYKPDIWDWERLISNPVKI